MYIQTNQNGLEIKRTYRDVQKGWKDICLALQLAVCGFWDLPFGCALVTVEEKKHISEALLIESPHGNRMKGKERRTRFLLISS